MAYEDDQREHRARRAADPRTNADCIAEARRTWSENDDSSTSDEPLWVICARGGPEELQLALDLSRSPDATEREMSAFMLGRFGYGLPEPYPDRTIPRLLELTHDPAPGVVVTALYSLGHGNPERPEVTTRVCARLGLFKDREDEETRLAVAYVLGNYDGPEVPGLLLPLTRDPAASVRDWATFAVGTLHDDWDSEEIRAVLLERAGDADPDTRGEALVGLARRRDLRLVSLIRRELAAIPGTEHVFEAAEHLGDVSLVADLQSFAGRPDLDESLRAHALEVVEALRAR